ncbi:pantetheine-phosphate adenylyltransferase [Rhodospirillum sp. A1_3_36]|uniref:pantetheine-phosphate adenylyltransferase n=1 Tax=Rhodospirillum sp. A1_3_36 TaxID=3391666 RepID=UPI0039A76BE9
MTTRRLAVYPGTFDPVTNGHLDIIGRAARMVDHLTIGVAVNAGKGPLFSLEERVDMVAETTRPLTKERGIEIDVVPFSNLLMDFAVERNATMIIRGLRAISDFEYEFQMCGMNARLNTTVETVFLMASERCQFISSRFVKEIGRLDGDISGFVSPLVRERLLDKFRELDGNSSA